MAKTRRGTKAPKAAKPADKRLADVKRGYEAIGMSPPITMLAHKNDPAKGYAHLLTLNTGEYDLKHSVNATSRLPYSCKPEDPSSEDPIMLALLYAMRKRAAAKAENTANLAGKLGEALLEIERLKKAIAANPVFHTLVRYKSGADFFFAAACNIQEFQVSKVADRVSHCPTCLALGFITWYAPQQGAAYG